MKNLSISRVALKCMYICMCIFSAVDVAAQTKVVKGQVVDTQGISLPGVNVYVRGRESSGVITGLDGEYVMPGLMPTDSLHFTYVGFDPQVVLVGNQTNISIVMHESSEMLEEAVVVAFARQKRASVIGSVNTINPSELKVPQSNLTSAMAGRLAGIISYQRSGEPGKDNAEFFVRGVTSFGYKASPLILIDGLEVSSEDLARLEPENVASFSIMKDATATALYGARGANGIILVTTKSGNKGKVQVTARVETQISTPTKIQNFLSGVEFMEMYNAAQRAREPAATPKYSKEKIENTRLGTNAILYPNVDWYGELFNNSVMNTKATITASGGGEVAQYYLSAAYTNEKGLMKVDHLNNFNNNININRYNIRANIDVNITKTTKASVKVYSLIDRYNGPSIETNDIFKAIMRSNPVSFPKAYPKDIDNEFYYVQHTLFGNMGESSPTGVNPYAQMVSGYRDRFTSNTTSLFQVEQDLAMITNGLKARLMASFQSYGMSQNTRSMTPFYYGLNVVESELGTSYDLYQIQEGEEALSNPATEKNTTSSFYYEAALTYNRTFAKKHEVGALLVGQMKESLNTITSDDPVKAAFATLPSRNLGLSGRFTYGYDSRYFFEGNFGYNGSEKFAKANRFGFFPSVGLGWMISNEKFYPEALRKLFPSVKFKGTYGLVGNDAISDPSDRFFYLSVVNSSEAGYGYTFGNMFTNGYNGFVVARYANPQIGWEVSTKVNYGMELSIMDIANLQVEYFTEKRDKIYDARMSIPYTMGISSDMSGNIGSAEARGVDASLDINWSINPDWWIQGRFNYTYSTNKYLDGGDLRYPDPWRNRPGHPINQQWGYVAERLFIDAEDINNSPNQFNLRGTSELMPGDIKYVDIDKSGYIDENDQVAIGYPTVPEIIYGFGLSTGYKNLDFSFFFQGSARSSFFIDASAIQPFVSDRNALQIVADSYWSESNPDLHAFWPRLSTTINRNNSVNSTWWLRDGSFLRLKTIEFGYTLPNNLLKKWNFSTARIFVSGNNLFCFSPFKLWDPEMGGNGVGYPLQRIYNIGINVSF